MKLIIAGSRGLDVGVKAMCELVDAFYWELVRTDKIPYEDRAPLLFKLENYGFTEIVHGACPVGPDKTASSMGSMLRYDECVSPNWVTADAGTTPFPADWDAHGKAAGPIRNREMAQYGDALLLIWDGKSRGSASMLKEARSAKLPIMQVIIE